MDLEARALIGDDALAAAVPGLLRAAAQRARSEAAVLEELKDDEQTCARLVSEAAALRAEAEGSAQRVAALRLVLERAPAKAKTLLAALEAARAAEIDRDRLGAELERARLRHRAACLRAELTIDVAAAEDQVRTAIDKGQRQREAWLDLRAKRLDGMAAELAAGLRQGQPCPVCGGLDHPAKAAPGAAPVTLEAERAAEQAASAAEAARRHAEQRRTGLLADLAAARAQAGGDTPPDELHTVVTMLETQLAAATADAADVAPHTAALAAHQASVDDGIQQCQSLEIARAAAESAAVATEEQAKQLHARIAAALRGAPSIDIGCKRLRDEADHAEAAALAAEELERASVAAARLTAQAEAAASKAGFLGLDPAEQAVRTPERLAELEAVLTQLTVEVSTVTEQLRDPELAETDAETSVQVTEVAASVEAAHQRFAAAAGARRAAEGSAAALERLRQDVEDCLAELRPVRESFELVDGLSRLVEGTSSDNTLRMRLSAYVLAARLEAVADAASERLLRMSGGRYALVHTDEAGGRRRAGLGLLVRDAWTGLDRDTSTLSGGESFYASLALALGLADVVTAEAGAAPMEMMFVDEGFGTLDEDTLEEVMDVLDALREGGRTVGVVSHVADLRQRIPLQLHVRRGRNGSTLHPVGGSGAVAGAA
jgi:exonuclease SbcC